MSWRGCYGMWPSLRKVSLVVMCGRVHDRLHEAVLLGSWLRCHGKQALPWWLMPPCHVCSLFPLGDPRISTAGLQKLLEQRDNHVFRGLATLAAYGCSYKDAVAGAPRGGQFGKRMLDRVGLCKSAWALAHVSLLATPLSPLQPAKTCCSAWAPRALWPISLGCWWRASHPRCCRPRCCTRPWRRQRAAKKVGGERERERECIARRIRFTMPASPPPWCAAASSPHCSAPLPAPAAQRLLIDVAGAAPQLLAQVGTQLAG